MQHQEIANVAQCWLQRRCPELAEAMTQIKPVLAGIGSHQRIANTQRGFVTLIPNGLLHLLCIGLERQVGLDARGAREPIVHIEEQRADSIAQLLWDTRFLLRKHPVGNALVRHRIVCSREHHLVEWPIAQLRKPITCLFRRLAAVSFLTPQPQPHANPEAGGDGDR